MDFFGSIDAFFNSWIFRLIVSLLRLFVIILWLSLVGWTYRDAKKRGAFALYWAVVALIFPLAGWIIYLIIRPPEYADDVKERELEIKAKKAMLEKAYPKCPACLRPVENSFLICPYCRKRLKDACPQCNKPLELNWSVCPYCKAATLNPTSRTPND